MDPRVLAVAPADPPPRWTAPRPVPDELTTPRLVLRRYRAGDEGLLNAAVNRSRASLLPWLPWAATAHATLHDTIADMVQFRRQSEALDTHDGLVLGVFLRDGGELVGGSGFHTLRRETGQAEIGYWTHADHRRRGYCAEATRWLISWMLTAQKGAIVDAAGASVAGWGFRRVEILCSSANAASAAVPTALGLRLEQQRRLDRYVDGVGWTGTLAWGVLADEWDRGAHAWRVRPGPA